MILTFKESQGHETWYEFVGLKEGYYNSNSEIPLVCIPELGTLYRKTKIISFRLAQKKFFFK